MKSKLIIATIAMGFSALALANPQTTPKKAVVHYHNAPKVTLNKLSAVAITRDTCNYGYNTDVCVFNASANPEINFTIHGMHKYNVPVPSGKIASVDSDDYFDFPMTITVNSQSGSIIWQGPIQYNHTTIVCWNNGNGPVCQN